MNRVLSRCVVSFVVCFVRRYATAAELVAHQKPVRHAPNSTADICATRALLPPRL